MQIVIFEIESWERESFEPLTSGHDVRFVEEPLTSENVAEHADADVVSVVIYSDAGEEVLSRFDDLQLVATRSTGYDHVDVEYCAEEGITVCNVPTYGSNTVAEHTFALLLAVSHRMIEAVDRTRRGDFSARGLQGFDLRGKTIGVVGTGSIGEHVIRIANGFGMEVVAFDVQPREELAEELGFTYVAMSDLLGRADVVTLHVPLNEHTEKLIGEEEFAQMKDGVVFLNTSRGGLMDTKALLRALAEGKVKGAGLDVLEQEPVIREEAELLRSIFQQEHDLETLLAGEVLMQMRNVVVTPHSAFNTREAVERILETTVENIEAFVDGQPKNVVVH